MAWIKFEKDLLTDPRLLRVARILQERMKISYDTERFNGYEFSNVQALPGVTLVCGALARIWCLGDTHLDESDVLPIGSKEIDEYVGIPGFCDLLPLDWLVIMNENTVKLPGFHKHNGTEAKKKAQTQSRVQRFRARNAKPLESCNASALPDLDLDKTKKENRARAARGSRFQLDVLPQEWKDFAGKERPDLNAESVFAEFGDYWRGIAGSKGVKLDWIGTWRNWIRRQNGKIATSNVVTPKVCGVCNGSLESGYTKRREGLICNACEAQR